MVDGGLSGEASYRRPTGLAALRRSLLDLLFPPRCVVCRTRGDWLCLRCRPQLTLVDPPVCPRCGAPLAGAPCPLCAVERPPVAGLRFSGFHEGALRHAVHRLKFSGERYLAEPLGTLLATSWRQAPLPGEVLVPVPLHRTREASRGYNQAVLLARVTGRELGLPVLAGGLVRTRETPSQTGLDRRARLTNLRGAFRWTAGPCPERPVLIDDVTTTGATLAACAEALRQAGARRVYALVLARAHSGR
ncbi:MAG: ComF family protein [Chloroflexi bacterium]|nr:ComF family protein [Chloroflexota bacterium]MCL5107969.1 ComF family protein [Chloroflexota bacterium]